MNPLAALVGSAALAAPMTAPPPPATVTVPVGYVVKSGGPRLLLVPGEAAPVYRPVYVDPYQDCKT